MQISHFRLSVALQFLLCWALLSSLANSAGAQAYDAAEVAGYRYVERTIYVKKPVTKERWVEETQLETEQVTESRPVHETEKRERRHIVRRPVTRTTMKEVRTVVQKPITETKYREREIEETSYETVSEMRDEEYVVRRPVVETQYRDEQYTVRQKVTEDMIEVKNQTVYKPQATSQVVYYPSQLTTQVQSSNARPRLQWLDAGYYTDPSTGQSVWRRRGLHWVGADCCTTTTALTPTTVSQTVMVPETIQTRRPVEVSRYEDRVETRRVPYEVERIVSETAVRRVPVTVKKPVVRRSVERVPYTETRYVDVEEVKQIPVEETIYEEVVEIEPYEVEVSRWKDVTREIEVPRTVRRKVAYTEMQEVAEVVLVKVPVDKNGRDLSQGEPVSADELRSRYSTGYGTTNGQLRQYEGKWTDSRKIDRVEPPKSVLIQETSAEKDMPMQPVGAQQADQRPTLATENRQGFSEIQNLPKGDATLDLDVRPATPPSVDTDHQGDVVGAER